MRQVFTGVQQAFGDTTQGVFGSRTSVTVGIATSVAIPKGRWLVETGANTLIRFTYNYPTGTFVTRLAANGVDEVTSDGFNVEFLGDGSGGTAFRTAILADSV